MAIILIFQMSVLIDVKDIPRLEMLRTAMDAWAGINRCNVCDVGSPFCPRFDTRYAQPCKC